MTGPDDELISVQIEGLPVQLHERAQAHADELTREFRLLAEQLRGQHGHVPQRLIELVDVLNATYGGFTEEQEDALDAAIAASQDSVDLSYELPAHVATAAAALGTLFDEADAFCRDGEHLLTLATPEDCLAYRRWFLEEFVRQAAGEPPTAWAQSTYAAAIH